MDMACVHGRLHIPQPAEETLLSVTNNQFGQVRLIRHIDIWPRTVWSMNGLEMYLTIGVGVLLGVLVTMVGIQ